MPRHRRQAVGSLALLLVRVIHAASRQGRPDAAAALAEFVEYALLAIPTRGLLPADTEESNDVLTQVARRHLGLAEARGAFADTTKGIEPFERRDAIQCAALAVELASDEASYCAGLAFGITFAAFVQAR